VGGGAGGAVGCGGGGGSYLSTTPPGAENNDASADSSTSVATSSNAALTPAALSLPVGLGGGGADVPGSPLSEGGDNKQQFSVSDAKREEQV